MITTLLYLFIVLCIVGLILWGISAIPGIPPEVKTVIYVIVGVMVLLWCLNYIGCPGGHSFTFRLTKSAGYNTQSCSTVGVLCRVCSYSDTRRGWLSLPIGCLLGTWLCRLRRRLRKLRPFAVEALPP